VTRAGDGASVDDADGARDDGFNTVDEAWFFRSYPPIAQECRTTVIGAISLDQTEFLLLGLARTSVLARRRL
jgi:hypothetical protein